MKRRWKEPVALVLAVAMLLNSLPVTAAEKADLAEASKVTGTQEVTQGEDEAYIIAEITEKREPDAKHFLMSDRSIKACVYPQTVHYMQDGSYKEIDNRLEYKTDTDENGYYENKANSFKVRLPEEYESQYTEFSDEKGYVKFRLVDAQNRRITLGADKTLNKKARTIDKSDKTVAKNVNSCVEYETVHENVDIQYDLIGDRLKETIILNELMERSFTFELLTSASNVIKNNDGSVSFIDEDGTEIYRMEAPYMQDSNGEYTNDVAVELSETDTGYQLTYTPDYAWLSDSARQYPVMIDPTLVQWVNGADVLDTYISNVQTASIPDIRGTWDVLNIGKRTSTIDGDQIFMRGLVKFDIPSQISGTDCILDARLNLIHYTDSRYVSNNGIQIDAHELTGSFTEGGTWWGNAPGYNSVIEDYAIVNTGNKIGDTEFSYDSYNITRLVNKWHNGGANYGVLLKLHDDASTVSSRQQVYYFAKQSVYYGSISKYVEITYRNIVGLEDYWSYETQDVGVLSGTGYVNRYNGNLTFVFDGLTYRSEITGFTLSHIYNSSLSSQSGRYGNGWRLNLVQTLEPITISGAANVKYVYTDGDGTRHYFIQTDNGIKDEDGLGYTYSDISEGELVRKLTDKNGGVMKFDSWNYLRCIVDTNGNAINMNYTGIANGERILTSVTTSSGGSLTLTYDSSYKLTSITDQANRTISYTCDSNDNVTSIQRPDAVINFEYENNRITNIYDPTGYIQNYTYDGNGRVVSAAGKGYEGRLASSFSYTYAYGQTTVTDREQRSITYQFDTWGRPTCVYDNQQNIYSQSYMPDSTTSGGIFSNNKVQVASNGTVYVNNLLTDGCFYKGQLYWTQHKESGDNATFSVMDVQPPLTATMLRITSTDQQSNYILQSNPVISSAREYTLSGYIKTENVQTTGMGAGLKVSTTNNRTFYSELLEGTTDTDVNDGFERVSVTFTLQEGESIDYVAAGLYSASGNVYIDCLQLEEGGAPNQVNLLDNSGFERFANSVPDSFSVSPSSLSVSSGAARSGSKGAQITGTAGAERSIYQTMPLSGSAGDVYSFGGWAKANSVSAIFDTSHRFCLIFRVSYSDGTNEEKVCNFNSNVSEYQFAMDTFIAKKAYSSICITACYSDNCNTASFDNLFIYRDTAQSYTYDSNGNVVSTADYAKQQSAFEYNGNTLSKLVDPTGTSYEYLYDSNNNLKTARSNTGVQYDVSYDEHGNVTSSSIYSSVGSASVQTGKTYYIRLKGSGKYMTVQDAGTANTTNVEQADFTGADNQRWKVEQTTDGYYSFTPMHAQTMALDITNADNTSGANVAIHTHNGSAAQKFKILPQTDYTYKLVPQCSPDGKLVTVDHSYMNTNISLITAQPGNNADQEWFFEDTSITPVTEVESGAVYRLRTRRDGRYVGIKDASSLEGSTAEQCHLSNGMEQRFRITKYEDTDYYTIAPIHTEDRLMEVTADTSDSGNKIVKQNNLTVNDGKLFLFTYEAAKHAFQIGPKSNEAECLVIDAANASGDRLLVAADKETSVDKYFVLEKVSDSITSSATYQNNGNYLHTVTDERGNTTTYTYDSRGFLTGVTTADGVETNYYYDYSDNLESVLKSGSDVTYYTDPDGTLWEIVSPSGTSYGFDRDYWRRVVSNRVGSTILSEIQYKNDYTSLVSRLDYGNGAYKTYDYDNLDRLTADYTDGVQTTAYVYDKSNRIYSLTDFKSGLTWNYEYDLIGRTQGIKATDGRSMRLVYDSFNRIAQTKIKFADILLKNGYIYGSTDVAGQENGLLYGVKLNNVQKLAYSYDELGRLKSRTLSADEPFVTEYGYLEGAGLNTTTSMVKTVKNGNDTLEYAYDSVGNITSISKNGTVVESYTYDALSQLKTVTRGSNVWEYTYDAGGNILSVIKNGVAEKTYTYGDESWMDKLTAFNGQAITYDAIGHPLQYRDGYNFTWTGGRQLSTIAKGSDSITYAYDADGLRTSKTVNGTTTDYYWLNGVLQGQKIGSEYVAFLYDGDGAAYGMLVKNGTTETYYYYIYNLQGDVIGILDSDGNIVVSYSYNAWGEIESVSGTLAETIGQKNPLRYRGYYYDGETGFYYLTSRYYDPEVGRFLNADSAIGQMGSVQGLNMFAYAFNNPVMYSDPAGNWPKLSTIFKAVAVTALVVAAVAVCIAAAPVVAGAAVAGGVVAAATTVGTVALVVAGVSTAAAVTATAVESTAKRKSRLNNTVYKLVDPATDEVKYVGRTNNVNRRARAHDANPARTGLEMQVIQSGLDLPQARAVEQASMAYYHTLNTATKTGNQINSIAPKYWSAYKEIALGVLSYGWNQASNEILYWTGN